LQGDRKSHDRPGTLPRGHHSGDAHLLAIQNHAHARYIECLTVSRLTSIVRPPHHGRRERNTARLAAPIQSRSGPLQVVAYAQVADDIQQRITEGEIELKLPSERSFAEEYEISYTTVRHAMAILPDRRGIITVHGTPERSSGSGAGRR
jgi:hypothetical protein